MTRLFGDIEKAQEVTSRFPITPEQVNVITSVHSGVTVIENTPWEFTMHTAQVIFQTASVDKFNGYNRGAIGAEATAQIWRNGDSNLVAAIKASFPGADISITKPAPSLSQYNITWS